MLILVALALFGCGSKAAPAASPENVQESEPAPTCDGRDEIRLGFMNYGDERGLETIALVCRADAGPPRVVVDETFAELTWSRWDQAWTAIEALDSRCRPEAECPPEPDTVVELRDVSTCYCADDDLVQTMRDVARDAGLRFE